MSEKELMVSILVIGFATIVQLCVTYPTMRTRFWLVGAFPLFLYDFAVGLPSALYSGGNKGFSAAFIVFMETGRCAYEFCNGILLPMNKNLFIAMVPLFLSIWINWYIYDYALSIFSSLPYFTWFISFVTTVPMAVTTYFNRLNSSTSKMVV